MRYWAGDIDWVEARYIHRDTDDIEDGGDNPYAYSVTYGFSNGVIANLMMSRLAKRSGATPTRTSLGIVAISNSKKTDP